MDLCHKLGVMKKRDNPIYQVQAILSRRDHSVSEVRRKLKAKWFSPEQIDEAITWAQEQQLLDDESFAQKYIESVMRSKAVGRRWLQHKLREKGVSAGVVEQTLAQSYPPELEQAKVGEATQSWRRQHPGKAGDRDKLMRFLLSRGFGQGAISGVVGNDF